MLSTTGLTAIPIIELEKKRSKLANERDGLQASLENSRYQLRMLRDLYNRRSALEQNLETKKNHLLYLKSSLVRLQRAIAVMFNQENSPTNRATSLAFTISVKHSTQLALDSISEADMICIAHLKQFNETFIALSVQISEEEKEQARSKAKVDQLNAEIKQWKTNSEVLSKELTNQLEKLQEADRRVKEIEWEIEWMRSDRTKLIVTSVFTFGNQFIHTCSSIHS